MRKTTASLISALFLLALAATPAQAGHSHGCGTISDGKYRVFTSNDGPSCRFARKWSKRRLRNGSKPDGYSCSRVGTKTKFHCHLNRNQDKFYYVNRT